MDTHTHYAIHSVTLTDCLQNISMFAHFSLYKPKLKFKIRRGHYELKTAENLMDLYQCFRLRYQCFKNADHSELSPFALDIDGYDFHSDHLIIKDLRSRKVVGTYRLLEEGVRKNFYSENEFCLSQFLNKPGKKLELGRACISKENRNSKTIQLLWSGLQIYFRHRNIRYLFGCSSVPTSNPALIKHLMDQLHKRKMVSTTFNIKPHRNFQYPGYEQVQSLDNEQKLLPTLLKTYLRAGAKVHGVPAFDKDFACFDLFTILDMWTADTQFINFISGSRKREKNN